MANKYEHGILQVLFLDLLHLKIPVALSLKNKVDNGYILVDFEIELLIDLIEHLKQAIPVFSKYREYNQFFSRLSELYIFIVKQHAANELQQQTQGDKTLQK